MTPAAPNPAPARRILNFYNSNPKSLKISSVRTDLMIYFTFPGVTYGYRIKVTESERAYQRVVVLRAKEEELL